MLYDLLDICDFQGGTQPPKDKWIKEPKDGYVRMLQIRDYSQSDDKFIEYVKDSEQLHKCKKDDIMLSRYGYIGQAFMGLEGAYNVALVKVIKKNSVNTKYLYYYFKSNVFKHYLLSNVGARATIPGFNKSELKDTKINIKPLDEQIQIVKILERCEDVINKLNKEIEDFDLLIKARFIEMFDNPATSGGKFKNRKLGEVADVKSSHRVFTTEFVDDGVPFYRGTEIGILASGQHPKNPYKISMEHYLNIACDDSKPMRGDLLLPSICNKGQVWMVDTDEPFYYKDGRVLCISPNRTIFNSRYLQFYMKMRTESEYIKLGSGSTFAEFKIFQLKELEVNIPPMEAQKSFDLFVQKVDKSKLAVQKSLEKTQQLFDSLMQEYFG